MAELGNDNGGGKGLARIETKAEDGICHDDSALPVKAQTIDELHSLQKKRSLPSTPMTEGLLQGNAAFATLSEEERHKLRLQSIRSPSLLPVPSTNVSVQLAKKNFAVRFVFMTKRYDAGFRWPMAGSPVSLLAIAAVVKGDPARKGESSKTSAVHHHDFTPTISISDSALKFTHILYNLSPAGRSPRDKRIVKDETTAEELWWGKCIRPTPEEMENFGTPDFTIYNAGQFPCNRYTHYMTSSTSIDINLARKEMVILGTQYAGEMKKGLFGLMHYLMPKRQILSLHSGCNMGKDGDVALFFGLSGKIVGLLKHGAAACPLTIPSQVLFLEPTSLHAWKLFDGIPGAVAENTRAAYPIEYIPNAKLPCVGPHPKNVILLACDAFGVLPPVSKLTLPQTMYHFISGYTALVRCVLSKLLLESCLVLVMLSYTRKIIDAIHSGGLLNANYQKTQVFGLEIPAEVEGVPSEILDPANTWLDKAAYEETLLKLAGLFKKNFEVFANYKIGQDDKLAEEILAAGPNF
ncbi:hypothetical protein B296_00004046 [Ensete ventricosum]|uniref:phosphoenolpyruvate carboxykinase (ATP) n=1 Tax=Ensete ventricosum TaxID=4639 RepID=A0A426ZDD2_ENSVE|nr:hypothetical protein B296_00004046 [Ensete ventricosum]